MSEKSAITFAQGCTNLWGHSVQWDFDAVVYVYNILGEYKNSILGWDGCTTYLHQLTFLVIFLSHHVTCYKGIKNGPMHRVD